MTTTLRTFRRGPKATLPTPGSEAHYGVSVRGSAASIVRVATTTHGRDIARQVVTAIERLPYDVATVVRRLREVRELDPTARITIDTDQLGGAVWASLRLPDRGGRGWVRYDKLGPERFALITKLLAAEADETFTFAGGLREGGAMVRALAQSKRDVARGNDAGSDLVVALALALADRKPPRPRVC